LLCRQLGLLIRAGRPRSPRHGFQFLEQHRHLTVGPRALPEEPPYPILRRRSYEPYEVDDHDFSLGFGAIWTDSVSFRETGHICESTHFFAFSWRPSDSLVIWSNQSCPNLCSGCRCSARPVGHRTPGMSRRANQRRPRSGSCTPRREASYQLSSAWSTSRNVSSAQPHESVTPEPPWP
jgi:hypothetical protein